MLYNVVGYKIMTVGQRIKQRREELGLSTEDVALKLNKNRTTIYRYESDEISGMSIEVLRPLADVLKTTPAYLMGWDDEDTAQDLEEIKYNLQRQGNFLRERREELGLELQDIADAVRVPPVMVSRWEIDREFELTQKQLRSLSNILEVDSVVITGMPIYDMENLVEELKKPKPEIVIANPAKRVPVRGRIAAGEPTTMVDDIIDYIYTDLNSNETYLALEAHGDSMNMAGIGDGATVLIQETQTVDNGTIAAISINGEDATIKEFHQTGDTVILYPRSSNSDNKPQIYNIHETSVVVIGKVVESRTKLY